MFQFHEVRGFRVMFREPDLFDSGLHLEPSIYLECSKVKLLEYQDFDSQLQLVPNSTLTIHHLRPNRSGIHRMVKKWG